MEPGFVDRDRGIEYGFLLHDVGKIGIPDEILQKAGPLTAAERKRMQQHTLLGEEMLTGVALLQGEGLHVVRSHHERWDGKGYPDRLRADDTPIGARIFAVADALDAMTSDRPYRRALALERGARGDRRRVGPPVRPSRRRSLPRLRAPAGRGLPRDCRGLSRQAAGALRHRHLFPEHDLSGLDDEDRGRLLAAGRRARVPGAVAEDERRGRAIALDGDPDDLSPRTAATR